MEDSETYSDLDSEEYVCKTELRYEQGGVSQKFITNEKRRKEVLVPGKLCITENKFGEYIEWKPDEDPARSPIPEPGSSREWAMVHGGGESKIGFKAGKNEDAIQFVPDQNYSEFRRPVKIEIAELRSLLIPSKSHRELIFIMCDGSTQNAFVFERGSIENLISAMERSVTVTKSKYNKDLYLVTAKKPVRPQPEPSVAELLLPDQFLGVLGVIRDIRNDPKSMMYTTLAKVADYAASQVNAAERPRTSTPTPTHASTSPNLNGSSSPSRNGRRDDKSPNVGSDGMDADYATNEDGYEVIFKPQKLNIELGERRKTFRGQPLSQEQWLNYLDNDGRVLNFSEIQQIVFRGGVDPSMRKHVWVFILGVYESSSTYEERREIFQELTSTYEIIKRQWSTITPDQEERFHAFRDFKSLIEKDVARTDRNLQFFSGEGNSWTEVLRQILLTYVMYNFNLGYVQGMSDILAPILMEVQDEVLAFWLFVRFMDRVYRNFEMSQLCIQQQLRDSYTLLQLIDPRFSAYLQACDADNMYFAFRWLLILFKREFSVSDIMTLWEALWTQLPGPNFQLFIGLEILEQHRSTIMENKFGLSEILRHVNDLSMRIDVCETLSGAESIYLQLLEAQDKLPNNIRVILGLPEKEEPVVPIEVNRLTMSPDSEDALVVINGGEGDATLEQSTTVDPGVPRDRNPTTGTTSASADESLEFACEMGISQFM